MIEPVLHGHWGQGQRKLADTAAKRVAVINQNSQDW